MVTVLGISILSITMLFVLGVVTLSVNRQISGFMSGNQSNNATDNIGVQANPSVPAAQPAQLTTRTSNTVGTLTMTNLSHGIITGQRIDLYWSNGQTYNVTVGTVAGVSVPITASAVNATNGVATQSLPALNSAVTVGVSTSAPFNATGNNVQGFLASLPAGQNGFFIFNNGSIDVYAAYITGGYVDAWVVNDVRTNPLSAVSPTTVYMSHNNTTAAVTGMQAGAVTH